MTTKESSVMQIKPPPPQTVNAELLRAWAGWCDMGDREVVREAAAKGLHVEAAVEFLSMRKQVDLSHAKIWFTDEIFLWVWELLARRQVYKVSHLFTNIKLNAARELNIIFATTCDVELREYLGNHLLKLEMLENYEESWQLLKVLEKNVCILCKLKENLEEINVQNINKQDFKWKCEIATELFFETFDLALKPFLMSDCSWKYLIKNNVNLIKFWINVQFSGRPTSDCQGINDLKILEQLVNIFLTFPITTEMIDFLLNQSDLHETQREILNELCKYGILCEADKTDLKTVLNRLTHAKILGNLESVFNQKTSTLTLFRFYEMMTDYCLKNDLFSVLNVCTNRFSLTSDVLDHFKSKHLNLLADFRNLCKNLHDEKVLLDNIVCVCKFLSQDDLDSFLRDFPLLLLAFMFFTKDENWMEVFMFKTSVVLENFEVDPSSIASFLTKMPFFGALVNRKYCNTKKVTIYELLKKHGNMRVSKVFNFRFQDTDLPSFNSYALVNRFGYSKTVNFIFYLKQARPSFASVVFTLNQFKKYGSINVEDTINATRQVQKLAIKCFLNDEITASCVAFLGMIEQDSQYLRILLKVSKIIYESNNYNTDELTKLLFDVELNSEQVFNILEGIVMKNIYVNATSPELIDAIKAYDIVMKFAYYHNLTLPESFLIHCAKQNRWIPFVIFLQMYNYPVDQIQKIVQNFESSTLTDHLYYGLSNEVQVDDQRIRLMKERDTRKNFLSRIGVRQSAESVNADMAHSGAVSTVSYSSTSSTSSGAGSDFLESDVVYFKTNLLQALIRCHNSTDPPKALLHASYVYRNPLFAVIATSYEPDSAVMNWVTWLSVSCRFAETYTIFEGTPLPATIVVDLLKNVLKMGSYKILQESFQIFLPDNPLGPFSEFLSLCIDLQFNVSLLTKKLTEFRTNAKSRKNSMIPTEMDHEMLYLINQKWIENTAIVLLSATLQYNFKSRYNQTKFLKLLCDISVQKYFSSDVPNFADILETVTLLYTNNCDIDIDLSVICNHEAFVKEITNCVDLLVEKEMFEIAFQIAKMQKLETDSILLKQWYKEFETQFPKRSTFWEECSNSFKSANVSNKNAVQFFEKCGDIIDDKLEKYSVLKIAYKWASVFDSLSYYKLEKKMWLTYFSLDNKMMKFEAMFTHSSRILYSQMAEKLNVMVENNSNGTTSLNESEIALLDATIEYLLDAGDLWQALRLSKMFNHKNDDLEILVLCCSLAEGLLQPSQFSAEQRLLLNRGSTVRNYCRRRRTFLSARSSSMSLSSFTSSVPLTLGPLPDMVETPMQGTLAMLESLTNRLKHGISIARRIVMIYRISSNIEQKYQNVFENVQAMKLLKDALREDCKNKLDVVFDFCIMCKWGKEERADFLCEEIINSITNHVTSKIENIIIFDMNMDTDFHVILQLLPDNCSILGLKLYSYANTLHKELTRSRIDFKMSEIHIIIELLIRAHDCFTADCNMEGISMVLKKCLTMIAFLIMLKSWKYIVRLLTGIARYTEMSYVFHILKENDQFEFLLRKGSRKDNALKIALLDYLKKYCPENLDLYRMVALHFTLFSEIAQLWEDEACGVIRNLIAISKLEMQNAGMNLETQRYVRFSNTDGTRMCLTKAMSNHTHATEYHLQGQKLVKALNSARQAELIALQLSMVKGLGSNQTTICLLKLTNEQIASLITAELSFSQTLIVVEAYEYQPDWSSVIYEQFIIRNKTSYLDSFLTSFPLTDAVIHDISRKFLISNIVNDTSIKNMKDVLNRLTSIYTKYRIASELGFSDIVEDLLAGDQLAYLKDTVWKKGYKGG